MQYKFPAIITAYARLTVRRKTAVRYDKPDIIFALAHLKRANIRRAAPAAMDMRVIARARTRFGIRILVAKRQVYPYFALVDVDGKIR